MHTNALALVCSHFTTYLIRLYCMFFFCELFLLLVRLCGFVSFTFVCVLHSCLCCFVSLFSFVTLPIILPLFATSQTTFLHSLLHFLHNIHNGFTVHLTFGFAHFNLFPCLLLICVLWAPGLQFV